MRKKSKYTKALGLAYEANGEAAPSLQVKSDEFASADEIVKIAQRFGIPIEENPELVTALADLELDEEIPEELFQAVALLLHRLNGESPRGRK